MKAMLPTLLGLLAALRIIGDASVVGAAHAELSRVWASGARNAYRHERAWCGLWYRLPWGDPVVYSLLPPTRLRWSTALGVNFECDAGLLPMHEHTGARCNPTITDCRFPAEPIPCRPSAPDLGMPSAVGWAAIVCGPDRVVFYQPHNEAGTTPEQPASAVAAELQATVQRWQRSLADRASGAGTELLRSARVRVRGDL